MPIKPSLTEGELRTLNRLLNVLEQFRVLRPTIPLHQVCAFIRVALEEGESVIHHARQAGVSQSVMSRHLLDIGAIHRQGQEGLGLVKAQQSSEELRRHEMVLTHKGQTIAKNIARTLTGKE